MVRKKRGKEGERDGWREIEQMKSSKSGSGVFPSSSLFARLTGFIFFSFVRNNFLLLLSSFALAFHPLIDPFCFSLYSPHLPLDLVSTSREKEKQTIKMSSSWSETEDASLVAAVKRAAAELLSLPLSSFAGQMPPSLPEDINWTTVSTYSGLSATRPGKACRLRYFNHLRPGLLTTPFTVDEDLTVVRQQAVLGNSWSQISAQLPGRTDNAVKNR